MDILLIFSRIEADFRRFILPTIAKSFLTSEAEIWRIALVFYEFAQLSYSGSRMSEVY